MMSPHETLFLETTQKIEVTSVARVVHFKVVEFPGNHVFEDQHDATVFSRCGSLVFVIDAQDEPYSEAIGAAKRLIVRAHRINPKISFDILIHKVDGDLFFSDEHKTECQRGIHAGLTEEISDIMDVQLTFHCTSIYDHSIFEAFSKVVQLTFHCTSIYDHSIFEAF